MGDSVYLAEVRMFAGNFAPRGWAFCHGQLLPINQNTALFSLLGTMYGGDGRTTFGLPELRGRSVVGVGQGPGLSNIREGQKGGAENANLSTAEAGPAGRSGNVNAVTSTSVEVRSPYQGIHYIICLQGIYPSRD